MINPLTRAERMDWVWKNTCWEDKTERQAGLQEAGHIAGSDWTWVLQTVNSLSHCCFLGPNGTRAEKFDADPAVACRIALQRLRWRLYFQDINEERYREE